MFTMRMNNEQRMARQIRMAGSQTKANVPGNDDKDIMMKDYVAHSRFGAVSACMRA
jgi:hypothetical protein